MTLATRPFDDAYAKFGPLIARNLGRGRPVAHDRQHLDELVVSIAGRGRYMWRAIDSEGEVLDLLVQPKRNKAAALKLGRKLRRSASMIGTATAQAHVRAAACSILWLPRPGSACQQPGRKLDTSRCDEESARCTASNRPARPSASYPSMRQLATPSTSSNISSRAPPSTAFVRRLIKHENIASATAKKQSTTNISHPSRINVSKPASKSP